MIDHILVQEVIYEEGFRTESYQDTKGYWTIGVGHLLGSDANLYSGMVWDPETVVVKFMQDLNDAMVHASKLIPVFSTLSLVRQRVLVNMMFNLGPSRFGTFVNMIRAINQHDYVGAHREMLDSKWAKSDVPSRAARLSHRWING